MCTFFASFKSWEGWIRKALIATSVPRYFPRQMSVSPPDATAILPRFLSPAVSTAEVGSCSVTLHMFPKAVTNLAFCESTVRYALADIMEVRFRERGMSCLNLPNQLCPQTPSDPLVLAPERPAAVPCCSTKGQFVASTVWMSSYCSPTPGSQNYGV